MGFGASPSEFDFFERRIRPVLAQHCYECHSAQSKSLKAGLRVDTRDGLRLGGKSGEPAIVPGDVEKSLLLKAIRHTSADLQMPPKKKLSLQQVADFDQWIRAGAPDPRDEKPSAVSAQRSAKTHWAFVPPKDQPLPKVKDKAWPQSPVDHFILAKLEASGLKPSPPADPRALIRRMTYDLTGLPPTLEEVEAFVKEFSPSHSPTFSPAGGKAGEKAGRRESEQRAVAMLVDRLLASSNYGERWARHWLDVARYADTKGYVYAREERFFTHAHAYRDWVVRALNSDLPYDRFLMLQIAGDQLVEGSKVQGPTSKVTEAAATTTPSALITNHYSLPDLAALGFLTTGRRFIGVTHEIIDDRIDVVTRGTMGLTVQCARCHDHKYDPIPTTDYYSLYGVFQSSADELVQIEFPEKSDALAAFEKEHRTRLDKLNSTLAARRDETTARARARVTEYLLAQFELHKYPEEGFDQILTDQDLIPTTVRRWQAYLEQAKKRGDPVWALWHASAQLPEENFAAASAQLKTQNSKLKTILAPPPKSMREVAERYGKVLSDIEQQWQAALALAKTNNSPPPTALPDPQAEALRQVLHGANSPAVVPPDGIVNTELLLISKHTEELWKLQGEVDRHLIRTPISPAHALIVTDREPNGNPRVFLRGDPKNKGPEVPRQFLQAVAGPQRQPFTQGSGRLELARAIASADNPLTARVMVNRVWLHHFGSGLVRTPSDFGLRAELPSHPELLDWLARRFIAEGWSLKAMHRLMLTSAAYQQSGEFSVFSNQYSVGAPASGRPTENWKLNTEHWKRAAALDPDNRLLWRANRQRLDFEELRDSLLMASGELDPKPGGKPVDIFGSKRRSLYGLVDRQYLPGVFRVFDFANPDLHIPQRHETTVSQQALFFLNHPFVADRAKAFVGKKDFTGLSTPEEKVRLLYSALYQREPTPGQTAAAVRFVADAEANHPQPPKPPPENQWRYGYGEFDEAARRLKNFAALPHYTGRAWQGGPQWPDAKLGWAQLTADGGHAGNDLQHAVVRRWVAPRDCVVSIAGRIAHETSAGDGVRAFITHSRAGQLRTVTVHNAAEDLRVASTAVKAGDTIDFIVDFRANLNSDEFKWSPVLTELNTAAATGAVPAKQWDAKQDFRGADVLVLPPLPPWAQLVQVLLSANEFLFVD
ncbi:MAG: PSD1 domain-containing protein [Verrucomicrobia bacterium]|nr:PSD1 domain-containing protein [Verrucomicrobiota bacterium]